MKETKMEKLLDLFIEYIEKENEFWEITGVGYSKEKGEITKFYIEYLDEYDDDEQRKYFAIEKVLSKKFWFIGRLVENEKVDLEKIKESWFITKTFDLSECWELYSDLESLLMLLSIQDDPIDYLNSILK